MVRTGHGQQFRRLCMAIRVAVDTSSYQGEEVPAAATGNGEAQGRNKLREY